MSRKNAPVDKPNTQEGRLNVYFDIEERKMLDRQAEKMGIASSEYVKFLVRSVETGKLIKTEVAETEAGVLRETIDKLVAAMQMSATTSRHATRAGEGSEFATSHEHIVQDSVKGRRKL